MAERPLNPWKPITDPITLAVLGKLAEELGEASSAVARCIIQGVEEVEPSTGKLNRDWLSEEFADVLATLRIAVEHMGLDLEAIFRRADGKDAHLAKWHALIRGEVA